MSKTPSKPTPRRAIQRRPPSGQHQAGRHPTAPPPSVRHSAGYDRNPHPPPTNHEPHALYVAEERAAQGARFWQLVSAVVDAGDEGLALKPEWLAEADAAERDKYVTRRNRRLYSTKLGQDWINGPDFSGKPTMIKISPLGHLRFKQWAATTGVDMQEITGAVFTMFHEHGPELVRIAFRQGLKYPWEVVPWLLRQYRGR
jgi:hypothetical protein